MTQQTDRLSAALADRYRIERELGAGGMATVYLAHDLKHDRLVAVKVLKPELAAVLGAERFVVEIKTTAALQHPHILPLFDSGTADGYLYYVMPFIDGETLRDKLNRETQFGVDEAVKITVDVADALHYAHTHGVIHRDIKPENILMANGRPMVADFGIALAVSAAAGGRMTETGLSLGTPHYMSPEQATAEKEITGRSDVYSLASVLYEMLTGEPPHMGNSAQQIIMKIITETPQAVTELRKSVPEHVAAAVAQALEKLPADRFATAAEFSAALGGGGAVRHRPISATARAKESQWRRIAMVAGGVAIASMALAAWSWLGRGAAVGTGERVEFAFRTNSAANDRAVIDISPDGRRIVQAVKDSNGVSRLLTRDLGSTAVTTIPGSEGVTEASFSPDGDWLVVLVGNSVRKLPTVGGPSTMLVDGTTYSGIGWGPDGSILYSKASDGLWRLPPGGGAPQQLSTLDTARREFQHWYPQALPGGKAAIFNNFSTPLARSRIEAVEYATGKRTILVEGAFGARYSSSGHLLFMREEALFAVRFDPATLRVTGTPVPVVEDIATNMTDGTAGYAVSTNGTLAYLKASEWLVPRRVLWTDRAGKEQPLLAESGQWAEPRLSPDGRWVALTRLDPSWQISLFDVQRRVLTLLTRTEGVSFNANWMPDSRSVIASVETPVYDLQRLPIDGTVAETLLVSSNDKVASSVSADGRTVAYHESSDIDRLMFAPIAGGRPTLLDPRPTSQGNADFSPDGRWVVYSEIGANLGADVYVRALGGTGGRRQVSNDGGDQPLWTRGGREIIYRKGDAMLSASFDPSSGEVGVPVLLFLKRDAGRLGAFRTRGYDVTPDGSRFLVVTPVERLGAAPMVVVLNWFQDLNTRVPK